MPRARRNAAFVSAYQRWRGLVVDGDAGPNTRRDFDSLTRTMSTAGAMVATAGAVTRWPAPDGRSLNAYYGEPGSVDLAVIDLPYPMVLAWDHGTEVRRTRCHPKVAESMVRCLRSILDDVYRGDLDALRAARMNLFGGVYNHRRQRGGSAWSLHAYGAAIDLDPKRNGFRTPWPSVATMPAAVIDVFEGEGWKSGARAWGRDAMHFQATQ